MLCARSAWAALWYELPGCPSPGRVLVISSVAKRSQEIPLGLCVPPAPDWRVPGEAGSRAHGSRIGTQILRLHSAMLRFAQDDTDRPVPGSRIFFHHKDTEHTKVSQRTVQKTLCPALASPLASLASLPSRMSSKFVAVSNDCKIARSRSTLPQQYNIPPILHYQPSYALLVSYM